MIAIPRNITTSRTTDMGMLTDCELNFYSRVPHHLINLYEELAEQNKHLDRIATALERLADKAEKNTTADGE